MLQKANDQKDDDHQEAEYTIAKFELIALPKSPPAALLLHTIQSPYFTKTSKQDLVYRHNNAFKRTPEQNLAYRHNNAFESASIRILDVYRYNTNCRILDAY
jgi:hypothetical protein